MVYTWPGGTISLWPVPSDEEHRIACWKSARAAFEMSKAEWVQMIWNSDKRDYDVAVAEGINTEPVWPDDLDIRNLLKLGFADERSSPRRSIPMSCSSAGLPTSFDRFRAVWHVDFEFRQDDNHLPVPVAMFAKEHRTGVEIGPLIAINCCNCDGRRSTPGRRAGDQLFDRGRAIVFQGPVLADAAASAVPVF